MSKWILNPRVSVGFCWLSSTIELWRRRGENTNCVHRGAQKKHICIVSRCVVKDQTSWENKKAWKMVGKSGRGRSSHWMHKEFLHLISPIISKSKAEPYENKYEIMNFLVCIELLLVSTMMEEKHWVKSQGIQTLREQRESSIAQTWCLAIFRTCYTLVVVSFVAFAYSPFGVITTNCGIL